MDRIRYEIGDIVRLKRNTRVGAIVGRFSAPVWISV